MRVSPESIHRSSPTSHGGVASPPPIQITVCPNPNLSPPSETPNHSPPKAKFSNLTKFVGHLWKGAPAKSFASKVLSWPADMVLVKMNSRGGRRNFFGQGCGGGGGGYGWGGGGGGGQG